MTTLGWTGFQFAQNSTGNIFVAQGNDIIGIVKITDANGIQHSINGFIKWRAPSGSVTTLVFSPSESKTLATTSSTYTISATKYIGLTFNGETLTINGGEVTGNAATNGLLDALNSYLNAQPKITIANTNAFVNESVGSATVTLNLNAAATTTISVKYATADSTATAGSDYTSKSGIITFNVGETTKSISVPIIDDVNAESTEVIKVTFSDPVNASLIGSRALINIADNETVDSTAPIITGPNGSGTTTGSTASKSIPENTTAIATYTANEPVTWTLDGGEDASKFSIDPSTGVLTFTNAPDFENPTDGTASGSNTYIVVIKGTDGNGNTTTQTLTVTVLKDFDGDGIPDDTDPDDDGDGILDTDELDCSTSTSVSQALNPSPFYFVRWNSFTNGVLAGTIDIAGTIVNVTVTNSSGSILLQNDTPYGGTADWAPQPSGNVNLSTFRSNTLGEHKFVFDRPINNPRFFINSLNRTLDLSLPGKILKSNGMFTGTPTGTTTSTLVGNEANGTISFTGNVTEVSFTGRQTEFYCNFSLGVAALADYQSCVDKDTDGDGIVDRLDLDSDGDGVTDAQEKADGTNPTDLCSFILANQTMTPSATWNTTDCDGDGADNQTEVARGSNPLVTDAAPVITGPNGNGTTTAATSAKTFPENSTAVVYTFTANKSVTWSLDGGQDAAKFSINATTGALTFLNAPDFENPTDGSTSGTNTYIVIIKATDAYGLTKTQTLTVTVTDLNECTISPTIIPRVTISDYQDDRIAVLKSDVSVLGTQESMVGQYMVVNGVEYQLTSNWYTADEYWYYFRVSPSFPGPDAAFNNVSFRCSSTPIITGPNGNGTTTGATAAKSIPENTTAVVTYIADETVTWSISGTDASKFTISSTGVLTFTTAPDFENPTDADANNTYILVIKATDASGNFITQTLTVTVTDVDDTPPVITGPNGNGTTTGATAAKSIPENTTAVGTYTANETVTWSISGTDASKLSISSAGVLTFATAPDFENPTDADANNTYILIIKATDASGNFTTQNITVTVTDVNEAPTDISLSASSIAENNAANATVGTLSSTDPDAGDTHTYSLVSGTGSADNASFNISGNSLRATNALDFETKSSYSIRIRTTDAGGLTFDKVFTVTVTNANEAPTNISSTQLAIYENNTANATVGNLTSTDPDAGDTHTYTLASGTGSTDNSSFDIVNNQLKAAVVFDFDEKNTYSIRIRTTDAGGLSYEKVFTITIIESPIASGTGNLPGTNQITAASNNVTISKGYSSQLNVTGPGLVSYSWSPSTGLSATNVANPVASPSETTVYTVTVTNSSGLSTVLYVTVTVVDDYNVTPNNIITPNGDGINDYWVIDNLDSYPDNEVQIFDKAGRVLYQVKDYQNNWDGTINSNLLAEGTYYYVINFGAGKKIKKGYITIIRD
jgi:gliding motility-associated-like protein